ncbi:hypothetical protein BS47DRAFT_1294951 [Hydnum rufescens UP504]|uniref:DEAD/DEAH-box helicase domain-containing protein n=1 Tax=Hydnum rufescens UP504 TaxID=1448309 RepID=A0A9P6AYW9_9AGAM|nr:hypothetical protein BS47DRAFT_1294951 [Hydnum rufescens UP504]
MPCLFQLRATDAQLNRRDLVVTSPTGSGKTLIFWLPLLFNNNGTIIIITPLNILGAQQRADLATMGIDSQYI